jgi:hypothetical protein
VTVLVIVVLMLMFGSAFLNGFGKGNLERAFASVYPGYALRIGELDYSVLANRLVAVLDKQTDTAKRLNNRVASFLANALKIRKSNAPDASGAMKEGEVKYTRRPEDEFLQFAWFALRTGVLDVISR